MEGTGSPTLHIQDDWQGVLPEVSFQPAGPAAMRYRLYHTLTIFCWFSWTLFLENKKCWYNWLFHDLTIPYLKTFPNEILGPTSYIMRDKSWFLYWGLKWNVTQIPYLWRKFEFSAKLLQQSASISSEALACVRHMVAFFLSHSLVLTTTLTVHPFAIHPLLGQESEVT